MPRTSTKSRQRTGSRKINEESLIRFLRIVGLAVGVFAIFTLLAVVSYLFTWKADQSLLNDPAMLDSGKEVSNWCGKLGYKWGHFLVCRCFGLGSFFMVFLLAWLSIDLFFRNSVSPSGEKTRSSFQAVLRMAALTLSGAVVLSLILAFFSSVAWGSSAFGGGLGGECGAAVNSWLVNLAGYAVTGFTFVLFAVLWLIGASGRFSRWFVMAGERRKPVEDEEEDNEEEEAEEEKEEAAPSAAHPAEPFSHSPAEPAMPVDDFSFEPVFNDAADVSEVKASRVDVEVLEGKDLSAEKVTELPRIDTREELSRYEFPSIDLLKDYSESRHDVPKEELERNNNKIRATLLNYKIEIEKVVACKGPTVTLYKVTPAPGVKISAIRNLEEDIAMALGARGVRVVRLADSVGIEVANETPSIVPLKSLLNDDAFRNSKYDLPVAIGYTITQKVKVFDLADAPHLLVAGATKQGKSVGLNVIITSLLYAKHPSELKFVFIDPKMVEFNAYSKLLKHYLAVLPTAANDEDEKASSIVKSAKQAEAVLRSLCVEMDERYRLISLTSVNNIKLYNEKYKDRHLNPNDGHRYLPYIVVVVDEYADLIMSVGANPEAKTQARNISNSIIRLAQKGRAAGIHVIISTQRPSVDVVTGIIKANFPSRIAFRVFTKVDSGTILDAPGADKLIGKGDMLYSAGAETERVQCAMIGMDEIQSVTDFIGSETGYKQCYNTPYYLPEPDSPDSAEGGMIDMQNIDENFKDAAEYVVRRQKGSTSDLQRSLGMGYARAGRVMDQLEAAGIVGPQEGSKPRQVLVSDLDELHRILDAFMR